MSTKVCPRCGSSNVKFHIQAAGIESTANHYHTGFTGFLLPAHRRSYSSTYRNKSVGFCPDCGYQWTAYEDKKSHGCLFWLLCIIFFPISLPILFYKSESIKLKKSIKLIIIIAFWILFFVVLPLSSSKDTTSSEKTNNTANETFTASVWKERETPLSDFDYYVDHDEIYLKDYNGSDKKVNIAPSYDIDGVSMRVVSLDGTFTLERIDSVIIPEGVTSMSKHVFNSCGVKFVFLPSTLADWNGWNYFHGVEKIYYGGTEEQWAVLFGDHDRSQLEVKQIIFEASPDDLS